MAALEHYAERDLQVRHEQGHGPVTPADHASNRAILGVLQERRPGERILSEESDGLESAGRGPENGADRLWVVDPLDGTKEFLARNGEFSVMVGLAESGACVLGAVYQPTSDLLHLGVASGGAWAGAVGYFYGRDITGFPAEQLSPAQMRARFAERGWRTVAAFQTRNPIHRAHEYLQKCALELVDGLLLHPLVGDTKEDDVPATVRMECYRAVLERYYPPDRVLLSVLPAAMRYAGPREAVFHAILRRNYGCTHFIVGRDHAGVGGYHGTYDAQRIFEQVDADALGIRPLPFEHAFWCTVTGQMATSRTSPSAPQERIFLSGSRLRELLARGERPPLEFTRPEVADILIRAYAESE